MSHGDERKAKEMTDDDWICGECAVKNIGMKVRANNRPKRHMGGCWHCDDHKLIAQVSEWKKCANEREGGE